LLYCGLLLLLEGSRLLLLLLLRCSGAVDGRLQQQW
jgi:hypothetical protein